MFQAGLVNLKETCVTEALTAVEVLIAHANVRIECTLYQNVTRLFAENQVAKKCLICGVRQTPEKEDYIHNFVR